MLFRVLILLFFTKVCFAQNLPEFYFSHLTTKDGLSSARIASIFQDSKGLFWLSTHDAGVDRYDGNSFKNFKNILNDSNSLPANWVRCVVEDPQQFLWMATERGLYYFNPKTEKGTTIILNTKNNHNNIFDIFCDPNGLVFVNTNENIYEVNSKTKNVIEYSNKLGAYSSLFDSKNDASDLPQFYEDSNGQLWLGSLFINKNLHTVEQKLFDGNKYQNTILEDKNKNYWGVTWRGGLQFWDAAKNTFTTKYLTKNKIHSVCKWNYKNVEYLFLSVYPLGLVLYNPSTNTTKEYKHTNSNYSILGTEEGYFFVDKDNRVWITSSRGINIIDPQMQRFTYRELYKNIDASTDESFGMAKAFLEFDTKFEISGSYQKGLFAYDKNWKLTNHYASIPHISSVVNAQEINYIFKENEETTWYSTDNGLVKKYKNNYKTFLPHTKRTPENSADFFFRNILKRPDGKLWIRSLGKKLYLFDPITEKFIKDYATEINAGTNSMAVDKENNLWITSTNGLFCLREKTDFFEKTIFSASNKVYEKALNSLRHFYMDKENTAWISSEYGLIKFNTVTKKFEHITKKQGLPEENLLRILEDDAGYLWINTLKGVIRYDKTKSFNYYTAANGLFFTYNDFRCVFTKIKNGNILFGYNGGIVEFNPSDFNLTEKIVTAKILDIYIDNKLATSSIIDGKESIEVQPNESQIKIHFSIFNYTASALNKFYFYIEGLQPDWQTCLNGNIDLYKLPVGKYKLHVKGEVSNAVGISAEDVLVIIIKPRCYQTNIFKALTGLAICLFVSGLFLFRSSQIRKKEKLKNFYENRMMHLEMQSLRSQMNPHFLFNTLNSINSYIIQNKTSIASDYLTTFSKLMRNILELSKQEKISLDKEINALTLYIELEALRLENKFDYNISIDKNIDTLNTFIPSLIIQPFVENAIWHGLHNKQAAGFLQINVSETNEQLIITVEDDGIGRSAAAELKKQLNKHKSFGIDITINRIKILNEQNTLLIEDLQNANYEATGTKVIITINSTQHD